MMNPTDVKLEQVKIIHKDDDATDSEDHPSHSENPIDTRQLITEANTKTKINDRIIGKNSDSDDKILTEEANLKTYNLFSVKEADELEEEVPENIVNEPTENTFKNKLERIKSSTIEVFKPEVLTDFADVKKIDEPNKKADEIPAKKPKKKCLDCQGIKNSKYLNFNFYKQNPTYAVVFSLYIILSIFFVILQLTVLHPNIPWYVAFARGAAILIYFNTNLIILVVLRSIITWIRNLLINVKLSVIDDFIQFHKFMGIWICILSFIHTLGQCINLCRLFK